MTVAVSPDGLPALVLNADYRPLSYYPLSLWSWQDAIKAVFLDRVNIVAEYEHSVSSPSFSMRLPSVVSLKTYVKPSRHPGLHPLQRVPARPFPVPVLRHAGGSDLRPCRPAPLRRGDDLGKRRRRLLALQSAQGRPLMPAQAKMWPLQKPFQPTVHDLHNNGRLFPPNYLHESWMDYLYWDVELEP